VCSPQWNAQQDAGRPFAEAVTELSERFPQYQAMIEAYHTRWNEMLRGAIEGTVEILAELRARGYFLCALSNWSAETFPFARRRFEFLDWFEVIVLSGEEETIKPEPAIYRILLERIGRPARECVFIDDAPRNVRAARDLGFTAVPFESPARLREQLKALDLDV
jgi:2-haloacid dehalogenase